jgi:peroxiredoxin
MENLQELVSKALEWHSELEQELLGKEAICRFLEDLNLGSEGPVKNMDQIHLMTLHNAKGLEFDYVFIVGLEEMLLPHIHQGDDPSEIEEERRLLYVGMTRAKKRLFLSHCQTRFLWGSLRTMRASRFLQELDLSVIQPQRQSWGYSNTSGCTQQACEMNSQQASWQNIGLQILGVSCDSATSHQKFKSRFQLGFPLLVDENSELMKQLGLWKQKSMYGRTYWGAIRSAFLLNKDARIVWSEQNIKLSGHLERLQAAIHTFVESKK